MLFASTVSIYFASLHQSVIDVQYVAVKLPVLWRQISYICIVSFEEQKVFSVQNHYEWTVPDTFLMIIDMDEGHFQIR